MVLQIEAITRTRFLPKTRTSILGVGNRAASEEWRGLGTHDAQARNVSNVGIASF